MVLRVLLFVGVCFCCGVVFMAGAVHWCDLHPPGDVVFLKSGGEFTNYCRVGDRDNFDRAVNVKNISTLRLVEERKLVVDGNLVILFESAEKRAEFVDKVSGGRVKG